MPRGRLKIARVNFGYLSVVGLLLVVNAPYFSSTFFPTHDTFQAFQGFYHYYSHFKQFGEIPHWLYHGTYGAQGLFWQMSFLSPASYGVALFGVLFNVENVLPLWKASIFIDQLFFLSGLYLLACLLFKNRVTVFFTVIGGVMSTVWIAQLWWNFRIFYLFPLGLYFLLTYASSRKTWRFWATGIVFAASIPGNLVYFPFFWLLILVTLFVVLGWGRAEVWYGIVPRTVSGVMGFVAFLLLAGIVVGHLGEMFDGLYTAVGSRDPESLGTSLEGFLTYGGRFDLGHYVSMLVVGWPNDAGWAGVGFADNTVYLGLFTIVLYGYACFHVRNRANLAILVAGGMLLWVASGGILAAVLYFVPSAALVRHLVLLLGCMRLFMLLGAGIGLDRLIEHGKIRHVVLGYILIVMLADLVGGNVMVHTVTWRWDGVSEAERDFDVAFLLRLAIYGLASAFIVWRQFVHQRRGGGQLVFLRSRTACGILLGCYVLDLGMFQYATYLNADRLPVEERDFSVTARAVDVVFEPTRTDVPAPGRPEISYEQSIRVQRKSSALNEMTYSYSRFDETWPELHVLFHTNAVSKLLNEAAASSDAAAFQRKFMAFETPKVVLTRDVLLARSDEEAVEGLRSQTGPVIQPAEGHSSALNESLDATEPGGEVKVTEFSANRCVIQARVDEAPAWLIYFDAWHEGWRARVDGEEVPIALANLAFKAIHLQPGDHVVEFTYDNDGTALFGNLLALLGAATFFVLSFVSIAIIFVPVSKREEDGEPVAEADIEVEETS